MVYNNARHIVSAKIRERYIVIITDIVVEVAVVAVIIAGFHQGLVSIERRERERESNSI